MIIASLFLLVVGSMWLVTGTTMQVLSAVRAYVGGEGLWSKAQKNAVYALNRYAASHHPSDYQTFLHELEVPLGDREARLELEKPRFQLDVVRRGFIRGGNHPDDVDDMAWLFRHFGSTPPLARAIRIWRRGDAGITRLMALGETLHSDIVAGHTDPETRASNLRELEELNTTLTGLEKEFSASLGDGARRVRAVIGGFALMAALLVLGIALSFSWVMVRRLQASDRALRESEQRHRSVVESAREVIFQIDAARAWSFLNPAWREITGHPVDESLGKRVSAYAHPGDEAQLDDLLRTLFKRRQEVRGVVTRFQTRDGDVRWIDVHARPLVDDDGRLLGASGTLNDVTESRRSEEALRQAEEQLRQAQKMEAVGQLAGGIAHDFNNLLTAILGYASRLSDRSPAESEERHDADEIVAASQRAAGLTRQLLAFSRRQTLEPRVLDLNAVVGGMQGMLTRLIGENIHLLVVKAADLGRVRADRVQLEQVILNLTINARDAMTSGGMLRIETANVDRDETGLRLHPGAKPGPHVVLSVIDIGPGIDPGIRSRIFEPFFTTKPRGRGTGLGLSTVHGIVHQSGGHIEVESGEEGGAAFHIFLPCVEGAVEAEGEMIVEAEPPRATTGGIETVLLVEDETVVRTLVQRMLQDLGYRVLAAADGEEALDVAARHAGPIDLLLTDVIMPRLGGRALARRLVELRPETRVVFMSGYTDDALAELGPGVPLIQKPFCDETLARALRSTLDAEVRRVA